MSFTQTKRIEIPFQILPHFSVPQLWHPPFLCCLLDQSVATLTMKHTGKKNLNLSLHLLWQFHYTGSCLNQLSDGMLCNLRSVRTSFDKTNPICIPLWKSAWLMTRPACTQLRGNEEGLSPFVCFSVTCSSCLMPSCFIIVVV